MFLLHYLTKQCAQFKFNSTGSEFDTCELCGRWIGIGYFEFITFFSALQVTIMRHFETQIT